ncbi:glutathione S-transferase DHAR1, mitochondrial-like isoform X2 [Haliotis rubra]|uniref:glutathione S-transferase DHAR1, mitochondrial-like isoform X2 n=1 Tax=Haliotis rubra TaxID=36100 RepID=UPI001EE591A4|nr:glutathione S-transferase DHAR1, mitochondrial-like isoform X2 [Haliotis rubra]
MRLCCKMVDTRGHRRVFSTMSKTRFEMYVKAGSDGKNIGDCPFSQRVYMYSQLKIPSELVTVIPVDITNKSEEFLKLNPEGKVPVLVDHEKNKVIADSGTITGYIHDSFPSPDLHQTYSGPAVEASGGVFGKLAALLKNSDLASIPKLKEDLERELRTLDDYLNCADCKGGFLVSDRICELDCAILPKLRHVQVAGMYFQGFQIPEDCVALLDYIRKGESTDVFKQTCPKDEEIINGWSRHNIMVVKQ